MAKELFGTDGIRGEPGKAPLDDATLYATGRALGTYLAKKNRGPRVMIGMDTRESGPHIAALLAAGLKVAGTETAFAGVITTPGVACLVRQDGFQAGVVAAHPGKPTRCTRFWKRGSERRGSKPGRISTPGLNRSAYPFSIQFIAASILPSDT